MPEGDTVLNAANALHRVLAGKELIRGDLNWPSAPPNGVAGEIVDEVAAFAKHMLFRFRSGFTLRTHLRMDGVWRIVPSASREAVRTSPYVRAALGTDEFTALGYRLGMLDTFDSRQELQHLAHMGPDIMADFFVPTPLIGRVLAHPGLNLAPRQAKPGLVGAQVGLVPQARYFQIDGTLHPGAHSLADPYEVSPSKAQESVLLSQSRVFSDEQWRISIERFRQHDPSRPIGETLLDQSLVSGIGTIHMAEGLFTRSVHPDEPLRNVKIPELLATIRANMIRASLDYPRGRTIHVHSRDSEPCHRCRGKIVVKEVGPPTRRRPAFFCPRCQVLQGEPGSEG